MAFKKNYVNYTKLINYPNLPNSVTITEFLLIKFFVAVGIKSTKLILIALVFL
jgi:phosphatidylglycerophosphate synthase